MRIHVQHDPRRQRFLSTLTVTLQVDGAPAAEAKGSAHGLRLFDVPDTPGTRVDLQVSIPDPSGGTILNLLQPTTVGPVSGVLSLVPAATGRFAGHFNPRLKASAVRAGKGHVFEFKVDLTFLDVTDSARKQGILAGYDKLVPIPPTGTPPAPAHYGVNLRLLEFTQGRPVTWGILVPPIFTTKPSVTSVGTFLFFRPTFDNYDNTDNIDLLRFLRYVGDPPIAAPTLQPFFSNAIDPKKFIQNPRCGWERQLASPDKAVILVHPMPHGNDFGVARQSGDIPELLNAVVHTLWSDGVIGATLATGVVRGRIALGGFSLGGEAMFESFAAHQKKVAAAAQQKRKVPEIDELYLFDSNGFAANQGVIRTWFGGGGKKLRLIGGMLHTGMVSFAQSFGSADATVKPDTADGWQTSKLYRAAVFLGDFASARGGTPAEPSGRTGLFVTANTRGGTAIQLQGIDASGEVVGAQEIANCSNHEAVAMIRFAETLPPPSKAAKKPPPRPKIPMTSAADFKANVDTIEQFTKGIRHQWVVSGGDDKAGKLDRGTDFVGYLQHCLEKSGF